MPRSVYVTGASGWLARELLSRLSDAGFEGVGVSRTCHGPGTLSNDEFICRSDTRGSLIVHCAFCRRADGEELVRSLEFSRVVFEKCAREEAAGIVNISSQSVYGIEGGMSSTENTTLRPHGLYPMAKAASEILLDSAAGTVPHSSLRLASLMGVSGGRTPDCVLGKFVDAAVAGRDLKVLGGRQNFSFLDIRDAVAAILAFLDLPPARWAKAYNVTPEKQTNIVDLASLVATSAAEATGRPPVRVELVPGEAAISSGGCNKLFRAATGWQPALGIGETVQEVIDFKIGERKTDR